MAQLFFIITLISSGAATVVLASGWSTAQSAPQQASIAALAIAMAVIPYVFARCLQIVRDGHDQRKAAAQLLDAVRDISNAPRNVERTGADGPPLNVKRTDWS